MIYESQTPKLWHPNSKIWAPCARKKLDIIFLIVQGLTATDIYAYITLLWEGKNHPKNAASLLIFGVLI